MTSTDTEIRELEARWAAAETAGDTATLADLTVDDFTLVGPLGFVLDRDQWLRRYEGGGLVTHQLDWTDLRVRDYGDTAVVIGLHTQKASFNGNPADGSFRATHVAVRRDGRWRLAGQHLSPVGAPPPFAPAS